MVDRLGSSRWSVSEARSMVARLRHVAEDGPEYDGVELFIALCDYLDQLHGRIGFDYVFTGTERTELVEAVQRVRGRSVVPDPKGERLVQPVNAAATLVDGRALTAQLEQAQGWQQELARGGEGGEGRRAPGGPRRGGSSYQTNWGGGPGPSTEPRPAPERPGGGSR